MVQGNDQPNSSAGRVSARELDELLYDLALALDDHADAPPGAGEALLHLFMQREGSLPPHQERDVEGLRALADLCPWGDPHWRSRCASQHRMEAL